MSLCGEQPDRLCYCLYLGIRDYIPSEYRNDHIQIERVPEPHFIRTETKSEPEPKLDFGFKKRLRGRNKRQKRKQLYQSK